MNLGIAGRVAIVTAASSGLGKATAMELAAEGAHVAINARHRELLQQTAAEIREATGAEVLAIAGDVTDEDDVRRLMTEARDRFGSVDILVANAGGPPAGFFGDFGAASYREAIELNQIGRAHV